MRGSAGESGKLLVLEPGRGIRGSGGVLQTLGERIDPVLSRGSGRFGTGSGWLINLTPI